MSDGMNAAGWIIALVLAFTWLAALAQMGRMQRRLDAQEKEIDALEADRTRLKAENDALQATLHARLQAYNWPYGFRVIAPSLREWPN